MFREQKGLEYALEILRALYLHPENQDSHQIHKFMSEEKDVFVSMSYMQKILSRMVKVGLLKSSEGGYCLTKPLDDLTVNDVLNMCPTESSGLDKLHERLRRAAAEIKVREIHDFN